MTPQPQLDLREAIVAANEPPPHGDLADWKDRVNSARKQVVDLADELLDENERLRGMLEKLDAAARALLAGAPTGDEIFNLSVASLQARATLHPKQERDDATG